MRKNIKVIDTALCLFSATFRMSIVYIWNDYLLQIPIPISLSVKWLDIHTRIRKMIRSVFEAAAVAHPEMHSPTSRAMYGVDVMLDSTFQPKLLEVCKWNDGPVPTFLLILDRNLIFDIMSCVTCIFFFFYTGDLLSGLYKSLQI